MNHRTSTEEEEGFEERMRHQVEDASRVGGDTDTHEHVTELADRRVGKHTLDVTLADSDGCGIDGSERTDGGNDPCGEGGKIKQDTGAGNHVDTGGDHGGGVDQCRDRGGALHGVGQPHIQRQLCRLAGSTDKKQQRDDGDGGPAFLQQIVGVLKHLLEPERAKRGEDQHQGDDEPEVADAVDDERLLACGRCRRLLEPERDQQIGAEPDQFPSHEQNGKVGAEHQDQHRGEEQVEVGEETGVALVTVHVADRVQVDQRADTGDDHRHQRRQRVPQELGLDAKAGDPGEQEHMLAVVSSGEEVDSGDGSDNERGSR